MKYKDDDGLIYYVDDGIASQGDMWMTLRTKGLGCGSHRVVSKSLPIRSTSFEAEIDLQKYAKSKGLIEVAE